MRDRERRLRRVTTRMTVRQRVAALLAAGRDGTAGPADIGRGLTPAGWAAFRRDCARLDQLHAPVRACLVRADGTIDVLGLLAGWLATIRLTAAMADQLDDALDVWPPRRGPDGAADRDLDGEVRTIAGVLRRAEEDLRDAGAGDTVLRDGILHTAPPRARAGDRDRRVRRGPRRRSARPRPARPGGPLPCGPRGPHRWDHAGPAHRADRAVRRRGRRDRRALPPRGGPRRRPPGKLPAGPRSESSPYHSIPLVSHRGW